MVQNITDSLKESMQKDCVHFSRGKLVYLKFKRILDILFSLTGLIVLFPVFLAVAIAIKLDDPSGSVIYCQERIGRMGKPFRLYKFRSMCIGAPELSTQEFTDSHRYVTRVGRFIRRTSIDELPQLWNVLVGNMSLVGPRPLLPRERRVHLLRFQYGLYQIRPGITGMAQTHGRDIINDFDKVFWDREYVENISLWMDVKLICSTVFKVVKCEDFAEPGEIAQSVSAEESSDDSGAAFRCTDRVK